MKAATVVMGLVPGPATLATFHQGRFDDGRRAAAGSSLRMTPIRVLARLLKGFVEVMLPKSWADRCLSDTSGWRGLGIAGLAASSRLADRPSARRMQQA
jgi:hypothetical protein